VTHTTGALDNKFAGSLLNAVFVILGLDLAWSVSKYFCPQYFCLQIFLPADFFARRFFCLQIFLPTDFFAYRFFCLQIFLPADLFACRSFCLQIFLPAGSFGLPASPVYRWFEKTPENGSFIPEYWG
jgi:hypothetical protein